MSLNPREKRATSLLGQPFCMQSTSPRRRTMKKLAFLFALAAVALVPTIAAAQSSAGPQTVTGTKPAISIKTDNLGKVLATPTRFPVYYWNVEKKAGGKIKCTGQCAVVWPPIFVKGTVQKHVNGLTATFGTIKRGSKRQLTVNGLPAYTYHTDPKGVVLCNNVDGWFAVKNR
jgi:predicted lipoprotein with Yx(FWY)xxD motif